MEITVLGTGSWGTALAKTLGDKGHEVCVWGRNAQQVFDINDHHENRRYLPGIELPRTVSATTELYGALDGRKLVVTVVPSHAMREVMGEAKVAVHKEAIVVSASKGIENGTLQTMDELLAEVLPPSLSARTVFLSGPSFAREVGLRLPTAVVVGSQDADAAREAQQVFAGDRFRVYTSSDVVGLELGGALKNVMAIAAGIADGLGFGHNTRAALITRGLAEMTRLATRRGANPMTLAGLAGMGDLVLTCTGDLSRNRAVGIKLGQGKTLAQALAEMEQVAEGVKTTISARDLGKKTGVELPITEMVYSILYEDKPAAQGVAELLTRPHRQELD